MIFHILVIAVLIIDQITKKIVMDSMQPNQTIPIIENIFHITFVRNPGAAFGILQDQRMFFIVITSIIILVIIAIYWKLAHERNLMLTIALGLQLGGALGNYIDRIRFAYVVDFFDFRVWPVFNVADMALVAGVILLAWQIIVKQDKIG